MDKYSNPTCIVRVEGTLLREPAWKTATWFALRASSFRDRLLAPLSAISPLFGKRDPLLATRVAWMTLRDLSRDRLELLGASYFSEVVEPALSARAVELVRSARKTSSRVLLIGDGLDLFLHPLAAHLDIPVDDVISNRLEYRSSGGLQLATGRLLDPVVNSDIDASWLRRQLLERGVDSDATRVIASRGEDRALVSTATLPCAFDPDARLRAAARTNEWPILEAHAGGAR